MTGGDVPLLTLLVFALLMAVFLALSEASLLRISEYRARALADEGNKAAIRLAGLVDRLPEVLNLILLLALLSQIGVEVPEGDWNTVAGMMMGLAGRLLSPGDSVENDGHRFVVDSVRRRRVTRVSIERVEG